MRRSSTVCLLALCVCVCTFASAAELPQASSLTPVTIAPPTTGALQSVVSVQLRSDEIAAVLEHLQSQHVYLKHLENMRRALEKELSIVRLMGECDRAGGICTGRGVAEKVVPEEAPPAKEETQVPPPLPEPASPEPALPAQALPGIVGIYREAALLVDQGRYFEVRVGERVGPFTVTVIALDQVELEGPGGSVTLSAQQYSPPHFVYESDEF